MAPAPTDEAPAPARPAKVQPAIVVLAALTVAALVGGVGWYVGSRDDGSRATTPGAAQGAGAPEVTDPGPAEGTALPDLAFEGLGGSPGGSLGQYAGRPLVINFFAYWCTPCREELPDLQAVHEARGDEVAFLGLDYVDDPANGERMVAETGVTFDVGADPDGSVLEALGGVGMPTTVFVRADGTIAEVHSGIISADEVDRTLADDVLR